MAPPAFGHAAFLGSDPPPGTRLATSLSQIALQFTEALNSKLSTAVVYDATTGQRVPATLGTRGPRQLIVTFSRSLARAAYRVEWHSVSTDDGHALDGSFWFGVGTAAVGGRATVQQSPLTNDGWLRAIVRLGFYVTLFLFAGTMLVQALLPDRGRGSWLVPVAVADELSTDAARRLGERASALALDAGLAACATAAVSALLDTADAAGGLSLQAVHDYLLVNGSGLARVAVVICLLGALAVARRLPRVGAALIVLALGALALAGHASSAHPRALALAADWAHLIAATAWIGGIGAIAWVWGRELSRLSASARPAVMRQVLARFGGVALPAFGIVVVSGALSAVLEVGRIPALWESAYGRVLLVKIVLVAMIASVSYRHALRIRPRLLGANPHPDPRLEERHWRLVRREPLLAVGALAAVALLVSFPLPPRQLTDLGRASAALPAQACTPCPLPTAGSDELAVADHAGSYVVAAWIRRAPRAQAQVRVFDLHGNPAGGPIAIDHAARPPQSCGTGCEQIALAPETPALRVRVGQRGHAYVATLPTGWLARQTAFAAHLLDRAQQTMRALRSVRELDMVNSVPGIYALTSYSLLAPDRQQAINSVLNLRVSARPMIEGERRVIGATEWDLAPGQPWLKSAYGGGLPFRLKSWFTWTTYAQAVRLLDFDQSAGHPLAVIALYDPGTPTWWRLWVDPRTGRVLRDRLITYGEFSDRRYFDFNRPVSITPPNHSRP